MRTRTWCFIDYFFWKCFAFFRLPLSNGISNKIKWISKRWNWRKVLLTLTVEISAESKIKSIFRTMYDFFFQNSIFKFLQKTTFSCFFEKFSEQNRFVLKIWINSLFSIFMLIWCGLWRTTSLSQINLITRFKKNCCGKIKVFFIDNIYFLQHISKFKYGETIFSEFFEIWAITH